MSGYQKGYTKPGGGGEELDLLERRQKRVAAAIAKVRHDFRANPTVGKALDALEKELRR